MRLSFAIGLSVVLLGTSNALAAFVSVSYQGAIKVAGTDVTHVLNAIDQNNIQWGFLESSNVAVNGLRMDRAIPASSGVSNDYNANNAATYTSYSGLVDSHMIFLNQNMNGPITYAEWTFSTDIVGVISDGLGILESSSTALLGSTSVKYPVAGGLNTGAFGGDPTKSYVGFNARGLEDNSAGTRPIMSSAALVNSVNNDAYFFSGKKLYLKMNVSQPGDWIRVITKTSQAPGPVVPEPASAVLFGLGAVGLCFARRSLRKS